MIHDTSFGKFTRRRQRAVI